MATRHWLTGRSDNPHGREAHRDGPSSPSVTGSASGRSLPVRCKRIAGAARRYPGRTACLILAGVVAALVWGLAGSEHASDRSPREKEFVLACTNPSTTHLEIVNYGSRTAEFRIDLNGRGFVESVADLAKEAASLPDEFKGEPLYRKVWRYTRTQVTFGIPVSERGWYNNPCLLVNSAGFGFCDDMATMNCYLWRQLGYESRCWYLSGHVVPEVKVHGRWEMYDSDLGVCYLRPDGEVAGVQELSKHPDWVTGKVDVLRPVTDRTIDSAQCPCTVSCYATSENNRLLSVKKLQKPRPFELVIPAGGKMSFPISGHSIWVKNPHAETVVRASKSAYLKVEIPSGWKGILPMPLVLYSATGSGMIGHDGVLHPCGSKFFEKYPPHYSLAVRASGPLKLLYYVNPRRFFLRTSNQVTIRGEHIDSLRLRLSSN